MSSPPCTTNNYHRQAWKAIRLGESYQKIIICPMALFFGDRGAMDITGLCQFVNLRDGVAALFHEQALVTDDVP